MSKKLFEVPTEREQWFTTEFCEKLKRGQKKGMGDQVFPLNEASW